ncbi:MAG: Na/Pi symporter [Oscillospiraceae bacterium]|nr:Na/Pi symporter [Oscillospiraceae bacterium]
MIIAGFGILFLGMRIMADAMRPLSEEAWIVDLFRFAENPFAGIALGFIITAIIQSSTAAMGILLAATMAGMVTDLSQTIFILYGQNLGTCMTVIISSIGSSKVTKKAAWIHLVYKTIGITIMVAITLLPLGFVSFIEGLSEDITTQLVYAHIIINVLMAVILLPFSGGIIKITEMIIRGEDEEKSDEGFEYIDKTVISNPSLATVQANQEVERYVKLVYDNFVMAKNVVVGCRDTVCGNTCDTNTTVSNQPLQSIYKNEEFINTLSGKLNKHLTKLNSLDLEYADVKLIASLYRTVIGVERMGNHAINIVKAYEYLKDENQKFSDEAMQELDKMFENTQKALDKAIKAFERGEHNVKKILEVKKYEQLVDNQYEEYKNNHVERVNSGICDPLAGVAFVKMLTDLERIADYAFSIVYAIPKS